MSFEDENAAHRHFSATLFNQTWEYLDKTERTQEDEEMMILTAFASYYHWTQRSDVNPEKVSIATWQISRVYAVLGNGNEAVRWARRSVEEAEKGSDPFFLGYGFEALARACDLVGDTELLDAALRTAEELATLVPDKASREALQADLATINRH